ncbi:hypothetical protein, partial [Bosea sp. (in: a-proteobacteria)]|uniref:hypothetical protein n=1 Tax=Bosea sp. (in: a-proteobacteria) TaxID=1871050 RepID=UPI00403467CA
HNELISHEGNTYMQLMLSCCKAEGRGKKMTKACLSTEHYASCTWEVFKGSRAWKDMGRAVKSEEEELQLRRQ